MISKLSASPSKRFVKNQFTFARYGAVLILSRTNSFRTLVAEAFLKSAIQKQQQQQLALVVQKKDEENETAQEAEEELKNIEIDSDLMFTNPPLFEEKMKQIQIAQKKIQEKREQQERSIFSIHPNLQIVMSAGRNHIPCKEGSQLHPIAYKLLTDRQEFSEKIPKEILDNLWRKGMSTVYQKLGTFDVIISIDDGEEKLATSTQTSNLFNNGQEETENDEDDDSFNLDDFEDDEEQQQGKSSNKKKQQQQSSFDLSSDPLFCKALDANPFSSIPGMENILHSQNNNNNIYDNDSSKKGSSGDTSTVPSHWKFGESGTNSRNHYKVWSPRNPKVIAENSFKKFQDDYAGEPQFSRPKRMHIPSNVKRVRWLLPPVEEISKKKAFETQQEYEERVAAVIRKIERYCSNFGKGV
jgi:hypothetical protein